MKIDHEEIYRDRKERAEVFTYVNAYENKKVTLTGINNYDQISQINWFYNTAGIDRNEGLNMRIFFSQELAN